MWSLLDSAIDDNRNQICLRVGGTLAPIKMSTRARTVQPYCVSLPMVQLMITSDEPDARAKGRSVHTAQ